MGGVRGEQGGGAAGESEWGEGSVNGEKRDGVGVWAFIIQQAPWGGQRGDTSASSSFFHLKPLKK